MRPSRPPVRTAAPASTLISVAQVKAAQRIDAADEDALIGGWIAAATAHVETLLGRKLVEQSWRHEFCGWGDRRLYLGFPDAVSVAVSYVDPAGATQTLPADHYHLAEDWLGSLIVPAAGAGWPSLDTIPLPVSVVAAHAINAGDPALPAIGQALHLIVGDWIAHRESVAAGTIIAAPVAASVERLLVEHKARWVEA